MTPRRLQAAALVVVLAVVWMLLQGAATIANAVGGAVLATAIVMTFSVGATAPGHRVHPWGCARLLAFVLVSLVRSSWAVIVTILRPTDARLRAGVVKVRLDVESPLTATIVANAITLTPGTMTLTARLDPAELSVHVLGLDDADEFRRSVHDLERRVLAAISPPPQSTHARQSIHDRQETR